MNHPLKGRHGSCPQFRTLAFRSCRSKSWLQYPRLIVLQLINSCKRPESSTFLSALSQIQVVVAIGSKPVWVICGLETLLVASIPWSQPLYSSSLSMPKLEARRSNVTLSAKCINTKTVSLLSLLDCWALIKRVRGLMSWRAVLLTYCYHYQVLCLIKEHRGLKIM